MTYKKRESPQVDHTSDVLYRLLYISAYLYLIVAGGNMPWWVYVFIITLVVVTGFSTMKKIHGKIKHEPTE